MLHCVAAYHSALRCIVPQCITLQRSAALPCNAALQRCALLHRSIAKKTQRNKKTKKEGDGSNAVAFFTALQQCGKKKHKKKATAAMQQRKKKHKKSSAAKKNTAQLKKQKKRHNAAPQQEEETRKETRSKKVRCLPGSRSCSRVGPAPASTALLLEAPLQAPAPSSLPLNVSGALAME
jgi:hypothetical protein